MGGVHLTQETPARLDHTRDGEGIPQCLPEIVTQQKLLLGVAGIGARTQQAPVRREQRETAPRELPQASSSPAAGSAWGAVAPF
jgi:hypothetical protein